MTFKVDEVRLLSWLGYVGASFEVDGVSLLSWLGFVGASLLATGSDGVGVGVALFPLLS